MLQIPPLTCDLSIHLDRVTVDAVRRLDQLAPFGAENPTPVFLLQNAVLDGVYPVSDGKHSRLRLRQGNASLYAVWFGMRPEQLPYATGDVVDTALNLSVYDAPRGAQLSGRIIDLHPAGLGSAMPQQAALVQALRRGTPLTIEQKESHHPGPQRYHRGIPGAAGPPLARGRSAAPVREAGRRKYRQNAGGGHGTGTGGADRCRRKGRSQSAGSWCPRPARRTLPMPRS